MACNHFQKLEKALTRKDTIQRAICSSTATCMISRHVWLYYCHFHDNIIATHYHSTWAKHFHCLTGDFITVLKIQQMQMKVTESITLPARSHALQPKCSFHLPKAITGWFCRLLSATASQFKQASLSHKFYHLPSLPNTLVFLMKL